MTTEQARNPKFTYTPQQFILSYGETALYISTMGDPTTGVAPVEYVKVFFGEFCFALLEVPIDMVDRAREIAVQRRMEADGIRDELGHVGGNGHCFECSKW